MANPFNPTWEVRTHVIPASHPRGYRRGVRDPQTSLLRLHIKQYIPHRDKPLPAQAITLIVQHAMPPGDNKESLEPFLWDLLCEPDIPPVRAIWAMDLATSGSSFLLNRDELGDEPHWLDNARDMFQMINYFQFEMKPPLVGYGHSWGVNAVINCAYWSPRMFQGLILCEPVIENGWHHHNDPKRLSGEIPPATAGLQAGLGLVKRRSRWASREEATHYFERNKLLCSFDKRVVGQLLRYELRDLPDGSVELKTPSVQVVPYFMKPKPPGFPESEDYAIRPPDSDFPSGFYVAQSARTKAALKGIHCKMLFQWSTDTTFISDEAYRERVVNITGTGYGGGGGKAQGQLTEMFVEGSHSLPLHKPKESAKQISNWLGGTFWDGWVNEEEKRKQEDPIDPLTFSPKYLERLDLATKKSKL